MARNVCAVQVQCCTASVGKLEDVSKNIQRFATTCFSVAVISASYIAPALADSGKRDDGDEPGAGLGFLNSVLMFVVIPLVVSGVIALLVMAPGWTKSAKNATKNGFLDDPSSVEKSLESDLKQISY